jgi:hypothetical protein
MSMENLVTRCTERRVLGDLLHHAEVSQLQPSSTMLRAHPAVALKRQHGRVCQKWPNWTWRAFPTKAKKVIDAGFANGVLGASSNGQTLQSSCATRRP